MSVIEPLGDDSSMQRGQIINTGVNSTYCSNWVKLIFLLVFLQVYNEEETLNLSRPGRVLEGE